MRSSRRLASNAEEKVEGLSKEFLVDLSRILRRHGSEPWHQLADALADLKARKKILHMLNELGTVASRKHEPAKPKEPREHRPNNEFATELIEQMRDQYGRGQIDLREEMQKQGQLSQEQEKLLAFLWI